MKRYAYLVWIEDGSPISQQIFYDFEPQAGDTILVTVSEEVANRIDIKAGEHLMNIYRRRWNEGRLELVLDIFD